MISDANIELDTDRVQYSGLAEVEVMRSGHTFGLMISLQKDSKTSKEFFVITKDPEWKSSDLVLAQKGWKLVIKAQPMLERVFQPLIHRIVSALTHQDASELRELEQRINEIPDDELELISPIKSQNRDNKLFAATYSKKPAVASPARPMPASTLAQASARTKRVISNSLDPNYGARSLVQLPANDAKTIVKPTNVQADARTATSAKKLKIVLSDDEETDQLRVDAAKTEAFNLECEKTPAVSPSKMPKISDQTFYQRTTPHSTSNSPFRQSTVSSSSSKPSTPAKTSSYFPTSPITPKTQTLMTGFIFAQRTDVRFDGMRNIGNTCYMNAVLQCLTSLPVFAKDVQTLRPQLPDISNDSVLQSVLNIITEKRKSDHGVINPAPVKHALASRVKDFRGHDQQDAHEFLVQCLDLIEREVHAVLKENQPADTSKEELFRQLRALDPSARSFFSLVSRSHKCLNCQEETAVVEPCSHLSLDVPSSSADFGIDSLVDSLSDTQLSLHLQDLVDGYFGTHRIEKLCEKCNKTVSAQVTTKFTALPAVLVLHLKRFTPTDTTPITFRKITEPIYVDLQLDLSLHCAPEAFETPFQPFQLALPAPSNANPVSAAVAPAPAFAGKEAGASADDTTPAPTATTPPDPYAFQGSTSSPQKSVVSSSIDDDMKRALEESLLTAKSEAVLRKEEEELQSALRESLRTAAQPQPSTSPTKRPLDSAGETTTSPKRPARPSVTIRLPGQPKRSALYKLHSLVSHRGSLQGGHYVSDVREGAARWRHFNDAQSSAVPERDIVADERARSGYLFFFVNAALFST